MVTRDQGCAAIAAFCSSAAALVASVSGVMVRMIGGGEAMLVLELLSLLVLALALVMVDFVG